MAKKDLRAKVLGCFDWVTSAVDMPTNQAPIIEKKSKCTFIVERGGVVVVVVVVVVVGVGVGVGVIPRPSSHHRSSGLGS